MKVHPKASSNDQGPSIATLTTRVVRREVTPIYAGQGGTIGEMIDLHIGELRAKGDPLLSITVDFPIIEDGLI